MKHLDLYEIVTPLTEAYEKIPSNSKNLEIDDLIINSIIYNYTQSYLFKKTFLDSGIFQRNDNSLYVGLISNADISDNDSKMEVNSFFAKNYDYIDAKAKNYQGGFVEHCKDKYSAYEDKESGQYKCSIGKLLKDYPDAKIPASAFTEFSDWKYEIDDFYGDRIYKQPEHINIQKINSLSMEECAKHEVGRLIIQDLMRNEKFERVFESNNKYQNLNLSDRKECDFSILDLGDNPAILLNKLNNTEYNDGPDSHKIYENLKFQGLKYISTFTSHSRQNHNVILAHNNYGIGGMLIYGEQFSEKSGHLKEQINYISSIAISREFRGNQLGLKLFEQAAENAISNKQILFRTSASPDGSKYLEKSIDKLIIEKKYFNIVNADDEEKYLGESLVNMFYRIEPTIYKDHKQYSLKKIENPYDEFISIMKIYRENSPSFSNIEDSKSYYESLDKKRKLIDNILNNVKEALKGDEIKQTKKIGLKR